MSNIATKKRAFEFVEEKKSYTKNEKVNEDKDFVNVETELLAVKVDNQKELEFLSL